MNVRTSLLLPLVFAAATTGCVRITYGRIRLEEPIADAQLQTLRPDQATLAQCLLELGAPHLVFEYQGSGMALGWVWQDKDDFGLDVSYTFYKDAGVSFSYGREVADLPGCVLWFDADLTLRRWQRGTMGDLTRDLQKRPAEADGE